ncbi:MAG: hypothetical protein HY860_01025 [Chlamydiales bacterium]|nr:hypothetical protein [Chlamydiales bacterium]
MIIATALPLEAKPLIDFFHLKQIEQSPFLIYEKENITLIVCGIGMLSTINAIGYISGIKREQIHSWLNIGIAASKDLPLGEMVMPLSINMELASPIIYPSYSFKAPCKLMPFCSFFSSQQHVGANMVVDMESYGFFHAASKFAPLESIQSIKYISDHGVSHHTQINKTFICEEMIKKMPLVKAVIDILLSYENQLNQEKHPLYATFIMQKHFSVTQEHQLSRLLHQTILLKLEQKTVIELFDASQAASVFLEQLQIRLNSLEISLPCLP